MTTGSAGMTTGSTEMTTGKRQMWWTYTHDGFDQPTVAKCPHPASRRGARHA